ncbi:MAG: lamin tail domain-containing protein [Verrucomicrobiae bacterium]|nr:lamin tail domain-containing protein [Verrucomicrobiae bacterium]
MSELMYHPAGTPEPLGEEFIELTNTGESAVDVSGWKIDRGISFIIPAATTIAPGDYLVLASQRDALLARSPEALNIVEGEWEGRLSNSGENVRLVDAAGDTIDQVSYSAEGDWAARRAGPVLSGTRGWIWIAAHDGEGMSLEVVDSRSRNDRGQNWGPSMAQGGTPGRTNSIASDDIAPLISGVRHSPAIPSPGQSVTIYATVTDRLSTDLAVSLRYRVAVLAAPSPRQFESSPMFDDGHHSDGSSGDRKFAAILPPYAEGTVIEFYVEASDGTSTRTWPAASDDHGQQQANALYQVQADSERDSPHDAVNLIMTPDDDETFRNIRRSSNALMNTSAVWTRTNGDSEIRYQCGVRVRGNSSRNNNPHPIRLTVPDDRPLDNRTEFNINSNNPYLQVLGMRLFSQAGMPAPDARPVQLFYNGQNRAGRSSPMFGHYALLEPLGDEFLARELPDSNGNLYKKRSANPSRDRKRWGVHFESTVVYNNPNWYRTDRWEKQTNVTEDDWSDLQRFVEVMYAAPDETFLSEADEVLNRDQWLRWFAIMTIFNNRETNLSNGIDDDYSIYRGIDDPRFILLPHDFDSIFNAGAGATETIFPMIERVGGVSGADEIPQLIRYMRAPEIERQYFAQLDQLLHTVLAPDRFTETVDQLLGTWLNTGTITSINRTLTNRRDFILKAIAPEPATIDGQGELVSTTESSTALSGTLDSNVHTRVTVAGIEATLDLANDRWTVDAIPLFPGITRIPVIAYAADGSEVDSTFHDIWRTDASGTLLPEAIDTDTTLTPERGPYLVLGTVTVAPGVTLTILPGTSLFFGTGSRLTVAGVLKAEGTPNQRIRFTTIPGAEEIADIRPELPLGPPRWAGIRFEKTLSPENIIRHADIEYAQDSEGAVHLEQAEAIIDHCTFRGSRLRYVHAVSSSATISNCTFPDMFLPGEEPHVLKLDNVSEHIKSTGAFPAGGHFIIRGNTFGTNAGHNDVIDVDSGKRSNESRQILQVLNNVFSGGRDELLDLGGDVYVDGNFFTNIFKDDKTSDRGYANAISSGDTFADSSIVVARNVFWDVDHAINLKRNAGTVFENNTVVDIHPDFVDSFGFTNVGSAINLYVDEPGATAARGGYASGNVFYNVPRIFGNADLPEGTTSILALDYNVDGDDPAFLDAAAGDFRLQKDSPARGAGRIGQDAGAYVSAGIFIQGEPDAVTDATSAELTVGGPGLFSFRFRVNDGDWSEEMPIGEVLGFDRDAPDNRTATIQLTALAPGSYQVSAIGRNFAGAWQEDPTLSRQWQVRPLEINERVRLNEILASNRSAFEIAGAFPDVIELKNLSSDPIDISGMGLSDDLDSPGKFTFSAGTIISANGFLIVTAGALVDAAIPATSFGLNAEGDELYLFAADGSLVDSVTFGNQAKDFSISRFRDGWNVSAPTIGAMNRASLAASSRMITINEWLAAATQRFGSDYIEIFNPARLPVALDGVRLTDDIAFVPDKFAFPALSFIGPNDFLKVDQSRLGFSLARESEEVALLADDGALIEGFSVVNAAGDAAYGRVPDGAEDFSQLSIPSPGAPNIPLEDSALALLAGLRITEILFSPADGTEHEFIELQNLGESALSLEGVRFTNGIDFTFGPEALAPGEFIVVVQNEAAFAARYGVGIRVAGAFSGRLNNSGETLEISLPLPSDVPIQRMRYEGDWYAQTSTGRSLEFAADPTGSISQWDQQDAWLPSSNRLGSPGKSGAPVVVQSAAATFIDEPLSLPVTARNEVSSYLASGLPTGLVIDRSTGIITGQAREAGIFDVTITANGTGGQRSGRLSLYVSAFGPFAELLWGELDATYSVGAEPVPLSLTAADASGRTVESFADTVDISARQLGVPRALVVVSEILDTAGRDAIELVNVSGRPLPTASWKIAVNAPSGGATAVHLSQQSFPDILEADGIIIFDDVPDSGIYFGDDLPWDSDKGWVMISDGNGVIIDFVPWGYSEAELDSLQVTIDGVVHEPGLLWKSAGLTAPGENDAWHRVGDSNAYAPAQWTLAEPSLGETNSMLALPFADKIPLDLPFGRTVPLAEGAWTDGLIFETATYGVAISATATGSASGSREFSVTSPTAPALTSVTPVTVVEGQPFERVSVPSPNDDTIIYSARNLPQGLRLDPVTGSVAGTVPAQGNYTFDLIAQNLAGATSIEIQMIALSDSDRDGTPDAWELENGLDSQRADSSEDPDSDGTSNLNEFLAGTDPHDPESVFRITRISYSPESSSVQIDWRSVIGRNYSIESSADLVHWYHVPDGGVTAATQNTSHSFFESGLSTSHYRVRVLP